MLSFMQATCGPKIQRENSRISYWRHRKEMVWLECWSRKNRKTSTKSHSAAEKSEEEDCCISFGF
jgi:hypothetical protein